MEFFTETDLYSLHDPWTAIAMGEANVVNRMERADIVQCEGVTLDFLNNDFRDRMGNFKDGVWKVDPKFEEAIKRRIRENLKPG